MKSNYIYTVHGSRFILLVAGLFCTMPLAAQLYFGVKGTYSLAFTRPEEIKYDDAQDFLTYKLDFIEQDVSPGISAFAYFRNELLYLQGEIGYRRVKSRFRATSFINPADIESNNFIKETHYLLIPISAGVRIDRFKIGAGPVFGFIVDQNSIFQNEENFEERRRSLDGGFAFNFGLSLYRLHIDLSYEYQFYTVGDYFYYRADEKGFRNQAQFINLGLGFLF
ncbi:MAG: outer membrane beta-barrel protein [Saprospiraceae bacterium]|nr:outer membrane beta-barrel protein [Saprospiraceae bacterium]